MSSNANTGTGASVTTTTTTTTPILHLRSAEEKKKAKSNVKWEDDVVDNENLNKKKSKICCIFHPNREFGESSDSSSGESSDDSDGEGNIIPKEKKHQHNHDHDCDHDHDNVRTVKHNNKPNAYERQPKYENQSKVPETS